MTSYFDEIATRISDASHEAHKTGNHDGFWEVLRVEEQKLMETVSLLTGDREFPDDLREKMQGAIAVWAAVSRKGSALPPSPRGLDWARVTRSSRLVEELHSLFHDLARRRVDTRFGRLNDSPAGNLMRRDAHDNPCPMCEHPETRVVDVITNGVRVCQHCRKEV